MAEWRTRIVFPRSYESPNWHDPPPCVAEPASWIEYVDPAVIVSTGVPELMASGVA
jgi:hypothetical protein